MFGFIMLAAIACCAAYVAYCYITAPETMTVNTLDPAKLLTRPSTTMDKLAYATKKSAVLFWQGASAATLMLSHAVLNMADWFGSPEVRMWVNEHFSLEVASTIGVVFIGITVWARVRNAMGA